MLKGYYKVNGCMYNLNGYDFGDNIALYVTPVNDDSRKFLDLGFFVSDYDDMGTKLGKLIASGDNANEIIDSGKVAYAVKNDRVIIKLDSFKRRKLSEEVSRFLTNYGSFYPISEEKYYISIGSGNAKISSSSMQDGEVSLTNCINTEVVSRLGSILRGNIRSCNKSNRTDTYELEGFNKFNPKKDIFYEVNSENSTASLTLCMQVLKYIDYKGKGILGDEELLLEEDGTYSEKLNSLSSKSVKVKLDITQFYQEEDDDFDDAWAIGEERFFTLEEIIERNPDKNYDWIKDKKFYIVNDEKQIQKVCKMIWEHKGKVFFDTETTGLTFNFKCRSGVGDKLVGMVFSIDDDSAYYFPVTHKKFKNICNSGNKDFILDKYFKPILEKKEIVAFNASFDWKVMYVHNICTNIVDDPMILFRTTYWNDHRNISLGLKYLVKTFLDRDSFELSDFVPGKWGNSGLKFWDMDEESTKSYACPDTCSLTSLLKYCEDTHLVENYGAEQLYPLEVQFSIVIAYQEFYGHCVNVDKMDDLLKDIKEGKEKNYAEMVRLAGEEFNPRSSKDIPRIAKKLNLPVVKKTATGNASYDKDVRKELMKEKNPDDTPKYPFIVALHDYLTMAQLESNFTKNVDKMATDDGFMFPDVGQFLETGRVSVKEPNYQSYNNTIKKYIVPRTGYYSMDADYSSIEYRILACMAGQENLIEEFFDPDMDYHTYQASRMFKIPYELVSKDMRSNAKGINFGIPYGMGDPKLGARLFGERTKENTIKAKAMKRVYFEGQELIEKFFIDARADAVMNSYSETHFGRRRYFDTRKTDKGSIERQGGNNRIQGTAADIYKMGMVRLFAKIKNNDWLGKVLISAFVHDEGFLEVSNSIDPAHMLKTLRDCMMLKIEGWCPLYIGAGFGSNWYEAKKTEMPVQVQQYIVDTYGETGLGEIWNGDAHHLYNWEVGVINDYKKNRVIDFLKNKDNWGKVIKPVENGFAHEVLEEISKGRNIHGVVHTDVNTEIKDMVDNLEEFCRVFDLLDLFKEANIQRPKLEETSANLDIGSTLNHEEVQDPMVLVKMRLNTIGVALLPSTEDKKAKIFIRMEKNNIFMNSIQNVVKENEGDIEVLTLQDDEVYTTSMYTSIKAFNLLTKYYMRYNTVR